MLQCTYIFQLILLLKKRANISNYWRQCLKLLSLLSPSSSCTSVAIQRAKLTYWSMKLNLYKNIFSSRWKVISGPGQIIIIFVYYTIDRPLQVYKYTVQSITNVCHAGQHRYNRTQSMYTTKHNNRSSTGIINS